MRNALLVLVVLLPAPLAAQGLGDAAAKERQKREQQAKPAPAKVFTDADLSSRVAPSGQGDEGSADSSSRGASAQPGDEGSAAAAEPGRPAEPPDPLEKERQERKLLEAEWRVRFANAREQLAIAEANSWREVVRTEFVAGIPVQMKVKEQVETAELKQARQALADLEEKFRRTGLPPGWAREQ
jgi:hypothetical protein